MKKEDMQELEEQIRKCRKCGLWETRENPVPGEGSLDARIMFIGEGPGYHENKQGRPFVGRAGKILDDLLEHVGLERKEVYIANILKCRPPKNRNPKTEEIKACTPYLDRQIEIIQPEIIAPLGRFAMEFIFEKYSLPKKKISQVRGQVFEVNTLTSNLKIIPFYHPAVATYNPNEIDRLKEDFEVLRV